MADSADSPRSKEQPREFNPRWKGYLYILVASLVNFASITNLEIDENPYFNGMYQVSLCFGAVTFIMTVAILALDRFQYCCSSETANKFNYTKAMDGKIEGYTLVGITLWWIVGVAHITQVDGIAYIANNIYFSSWVTLVACVYTLDKWSAAKDILSIEELTGLSATLKSWYLLFLASLVTMGTSCDLHITLSDEYKSSSAYGIVLGLISTLVALFFILVHYRLVDYEVLQVGGWMEVSASFFMILLWVVGVAILTSEGGIAATIGGSGCTARTSLEYAYETDVGFGDGCFVVWEPNEEETTDRPTQLPRPETEPPKPKPTSRPKPTTVTPTDSPTPEGTVQGATLPPTNAQSEAPTASTTTEEVTTEPPETASPSNVTNSSLPDTATDISNATTLDIEVQGSVVFFEGEGGGPDNLTGIEDASIPMDDFDGANITNSTDTVNEPARRLQEVNATGTTDNTTVWETRPTQRPTRVPVLNVSIEPPTVSPFSNYNRVSCTDVLDRQIPGSNLYLASWICFFASFNITLRWKAAQAIQFAQAQHRKADEQAAAEDDVASERENDDGDAVDDDDKL